MKNVILGALALLAVACNTSDANKSGEPAKGDSKKEQSGDTKQASAAATKELKIEKLGLKFEYDAAKSDGAMFNDMGDSVLVNLANVSLTVTPAKADEPKTADAAKKDADAFNPKNMKEEKLADGWFITFDNTGSAGANFFLVMRREIGGKAYKCETTANDDAQRQEAIKICKSLKQ